MTPLLIALVLAASPVACPDCPTTPAPKVFQMPIRCKAGLVLAKCGDEYRCVPPAQAKAMEADRIKQEPPAERKVIEMPELAIEAKPPPAEPPPAVVVPVVPMPPPAVIVQPPEQPKKASPWSLSVLGEVGGTVTCNKDTTWLLGLRERYAPLHLGVQAYTLFDKGIGAEALVYPLQFDSFRLHLQGGVLYHDGQHAISVRDIDRNWDFNLGLGIDIPLSKYLELVGDANWYRPFGAPNGFDSGKVTEHSLCQTLVQGGLLWHF